MLEFKFKDSNASFLSYRFTFSGLRGLRSRLMGEKFDIDPRLAREGREAEKDLRATLSSGGRPGRTGEFVLAEISPNKQHMEGVNTELGVTLATEADIISNGPAMVDYRGVPSSVMRIIEIKNREDIYPMDVFQALWMLTVANLNDFDVDAVDCAVYAVKSENYVMVNDQDREVCAEQISRLVLIARILAEGKSLKASGRNAYKSEFLNTFATVLNQISINFNLSE